MKGLEAGYRGSLVNNKVSLDADFYYNIYHNLMVQVEANIPKINTNDSILWYLNDKQKQDRYRLWTNSKTVSYNYGRTSGISWEMPEKFMLSGIVTLAKLDRADQKDGLEDGFNSPTWIYNLTVGNPSIFTRFGFQINYRWQNSYLWQSSLATGTVRAYSAVDAQLQYRTIKNNLSIKLGATNLLNKYYYSFIGDPPIGGFYCATTTTDLFLNFFNLKKKPE